MSPGQYSTRDEFPGEVEPARLCSNILYSVLERGLLAPGIANIGGINPSRTLESMRACFRSLLPKSAERGMPHREDEVGTLRVSLQENMDVRNGLCDVASRPSALTVTISKPVAHLVCHEQAVVHKHHCLGNSPAFARVHLARRVRRNGRCFRLCG